MIGALLRVTGWLTAALVVLGALFWALVSTPESNVWMLSLSLLLILALVAVSGVALDVAMRLWRNLALRPTGVGELVWPGLRLLPAIALFALVWWVAVTTGAQVEASRGRITAAIIVRTGWANPEAIFTTARWFAALVAWVVGPLLALGLFGALTRGTALASAGRWVRQALSLRTLAAGALLAVALAWFWPWLEGWRPALPPTAVQLVFAVAKGMVGLAALALVAAGYIRLAALEPPSRRS